MGRKGKNRAHVAKNKVARATKMSTPWKTLRRVFDNSYEKLPDHLVQNFCTNCDVEDFDSFLDKICGEEYFGTLIVKSLKKEERVTNTQEDDFEVVVVDSLARTFHDAINKETNFANIGAGAIKKWLFGHGVPCLLQYQACTIRFFIEVRLRTTFHDDNFGHFMTHLYNETFFFEKTKCDLDKLLLASIERGKHCVEFDDFFETFSDNFLDECLYEIEAPKLDRNHVAGWLAGPGRELVRDRIFEAMSDFEKNWKQSIYKEVGIVPYFMNGDDEVQIVTPCVEDSVSNDDIDFVQDCDEFLQELKLSK